MTDDQRFDSFGFMGHPFLTTPNLDRLAREGIAFANSFVTTSLCCPSRATMWTGLYAHEHGVLGNRDDLAEDAVTWPRLLQRAGFKTAFVGKWHLGGDKLTQRPGFDHWVAFRGQGQYLYPGPDRLPLEDRALDVNGVRTPVAGYITDLLTDFAVEWLKRVPKDERFALVLSHKAAHAPHEPAERHRDAFKGAATPKPPSEKDLADLPRWLRDLSAGEFSAHAPYGGRWPNFASWYLDYHRTLLAVDESVGRVMEALAASGRLDETTVLFTSDNGFMMGERGVLDKRCFYEESIRVPLLVRSPVVKQPGRQPEEMVLNLDLAPTLLEIGGLTPPEPMSGKSLVPLLAVEPVKWRTEWLYEYFFEKAYPETPTMIGLRTKDFKLWSFHGVPEHDALFHLADDSAERVNRWDDASLLDRRRGLGKRLRQAADRHGLLLEPVWGRSRLATMADPPGHSEGDDGG